MDVNVPHWRDVPITLSPDSWYRAKVVVGRKPNGQLDRRQRAGRTEAEVRRKLKELLGKVEAGKKPKVGKVPTVEQWFTTWLTDIAPHGKRKLKRRTLDDYWSRCRNWIFPYIGAIRIDGLEPEDLDRLYEAMYATRANGRAKKPASEGHVLKTHAVIRRGLEIALRRGKLTLNVAKMIDPPGAPTEARESLSREARKAVVEEVERRRNAARWILGLVTGPRQGEALGLRWSDLAIDEGDGEPHTISIEWQLQRLTWRHGCDDPKACAAPRCKTKRCPPKYQHGCDDATVCKKFAHFCPARRTVAGCSRHPGKKGCPELCRPGCDKHANRCPEKVDGGLVFTRPKGWRRNPHPRVTALPQFLARMLREHRAMQAAERLQAGNRWQDHDLVFCHRDGRPIDPRVDWGEWKDILQAAGVPAARTHVMRHDTATHLLDLGIDIAIVQEVLGHKDVRTTAGYQHVTVEITKKAADAMDAAFGASVTDLVTERVRRRSSG